MCTEPPRPPPPPLPPLPPLTDAAPAFIPLKTLPSKFNLSVKLLQWLVCVSHWRQRRRRWLRDSDVVNEISDSLAAWRLFKSVDMPIKLRSLKLKKESLTLEIGEAKVIPSHWDNHMLLLLLHLLTNLCRSRRDKRTKFHRPAAPAFKLAGDTATGAEQCVSIWIRFLTDGRLDLNGIVFVLIGATGGEKSFSVSCKKIRISPVGSHLNNRFQMWHLCLIFYEWNENGAEINSS